MESNPLFRLILEQISWSYAILDKTEVEIHKKGKAAQYISCLDEIKPNTSKLYGHYSEQAHLDIPGMKEYIFVSRNKEIGYKTRSGTKSKEKYWDYLLVCELYILSIEKVISKLELGQEVVRLTNSQEYTISECLESIKQIFYANLEFFQTGFFSHPITGEQVDLVFDEY